jgi:hypothetical protein
LGEKTLSAQLLRVRYWEAKKHRLHEKSKAVAALTTALITIIAKHKHLTETTGNENIISVKVWER